MLFMIHVYIGIPENEILYLKIKNSGVSCG